MSNLQLPPGVTREQIDRIKKSRGYCHRAFFAIGEPKQISVREAAAMNNQTILPADVNPDEQVMVIMPKTGAQLCIREECPMWDHKKQRCLDRAMALKVVYGDANFTEADAPKKEEEGG